MKRTFIGLLFLFFTGSAFAQGSLSSYGFRLGLTAHPTVGWVKPQVGKSNGVSLGFSYGLLADVNFAENYSFATGVTITTINGRNTLVETSSGTPAQTAVERKYKLQYLEVPLTIKLKTVKINEVRWYGQFGLSNDFKIGAKQSGDGIVAGSTQDGSGEDISDVTKFYRAGLILGAGGEFDLNGNTSIAAGLTFNNGFTNITTDKNNNIRNHYIGINFGVFF